MEQAGSPWESQGWGKANGTNQWPGSDLDTELRERDKGDDGDGDDDGTRGREPQRPVCVGERHKHTGTNMNSWNTAWSDRALEVQYSINQPSNVIPLPQNNGLHLIEGTPSLTRKVLCGP